MRWFGEADDTAGDVSTTEEMLMMRPLTGFFLAHHFGALWHIISSSVRLVSITFCHVCHLLMRIMRVSRDACYVYLTFHETLDVVRSLTLNRTQICCRRCLDLPPLVGAWPSGIKRPRLAKSEWSVAPMPWKHQ